MTLENVISLLLYLMLYAYLYIGIYTLSLRRNDFVNRAFFGLCLSASTWVLTFSIANSAQNYESALFWRMLSVFGWGIFYSLMLDFTLLLTNKSLLLRKKWLYLVIYGPVLINILVFALISNIALDQYNLVRTEAGWIHVTENTLWEWYFRIYYILFTLVSGFVLLNWGLKHEERHVKIKSIILVVSIGLSIVLGTLTESVVNYYFSVKVPQVGPLFIIFPLLAIMWSLKELGFVDTKLERADLTKGKYLTVETHEKLLALTARLFLNTAYLIFGWQRFFAHQELVRFMPITTLIFMSGAFILFAVSLNLKETLINKALKLIVFTTVPISIFYGINQTASTGWIVPIVFTLIAIAFNDRTMLWGIGGTTMASYIIVWILQPSQDIDFTFTGHLIRLFAIFLVGQIALFINNIYTLRLNQVELQLENNRFTSQSMDILDTINEGNFVQRVEQILETSCTYLGVDSACLYLSPKHIGLVPNEYHWYSQGVKPDFLQAVDESIVVNDDIDLNELSHKLTTELNFMDSKCFKLEDKDHVLGVLVVSSHHGRIDISHDQKLALDIITGKLSATFYKLSSDMKLYDMVYFDEMTHLPNRQSLEIYLQGLHALSQEYTLILVGVDEFRKVNDYYGHHYGDQLLASLAEKLVDLDNSHAYTARLMGDIFALVLTDVNSKNESSAIANKILEISHEPSMDKEFFIKAHLSLGIFQWQSKEMSFQEVLRNTDIALNISKGKGGNCYTHYESSMLDEFMETLSLEDALKKAIEEQAFILLFQPKIKCETNEMVGVEVLLRWKHPLKGFISPLVFIPMAERKGWISEIDRWVFEQASNQNKSWQLKGYPALVMSINISPTSIVNEVNKNELMGAIEAMQWDTNYIEIELTENSIYTLDQQVISNLNFIKAQGISIALDDFGVAHSSLSRLNDLPIGHIKIDKRFIDDLEYDEKSIKLLKGIVNLSKSIGLKTTAEGVETQGQYEIVKESGCDEIQGYYYSKPLPANEIEHILAGGDLLFKPKGGAAL